jgi:integrase
MARARNARSWYDHAIAYVDVKWPRASAKHRKGIAEALATVTPALLSTSRGLPSDKAIRAALYGWSFNKARRDAGDPPAELATAVRWLESNTVDLSALTDAALIRKALDTIALRMKDGGAASASTNARKRAIFSGALKYAVELRLLEAHPLSLVSWIAPKHDDEVDAKAVVNPAQARALLAAVRDRMPELVAFFGCMYYAALRPEEVLNLREDEYERPKVKGGWGVLHLTGSTIAVGHGWGDEDGTIERRGLKHRAKSATRPVPAPPRSAACSTTTSPSTSPRPTARCSSPGAAPAVATCRRSASPSRATPTARRGATPVRPPSRPCNSGPRWRSVPTTCGTPPCRSG